MTRQRLRASDCPTCAKAAGRRRFEKSVETSPLAAQDGRGVEAPMRRPPDNKSATH